MRELTITLGVTCLAFSFAACSTALLVETDEQSIRETYKAWVEATNEKDIEKWSTFLATSPYFHPADSSPLANTDEVISYYERSFADPRFSLDCRQEHVDVSASGQMAWSSGECKATSPALMAMKQLARVVGLKCGLSSRMAHGGAASIRGGTSITFDASDRFWPKAAPEIRAFQQFRTSAIGESGHLALSNVHYPLKSCHSPALG